MTLWFVWGCAGSLDGGKCVSLLGMIKWCYGLENIYIWKFNPGVLSGEFSRVKLYV